MTAISAGSSTPSLYSRAVKVVDPALVERWATSSVPCPICRSTQTRPRYEIDGLTNLLWECADCGLGWMQPQPTAPEIAAFYPSNYYGAEGEKFGRWIEPLVRFVGARRVRFLTRGLPPGAAVLDVGCGRGLLLHELAERGFAAHGTEMSVEATRGIDPRVQVRIAPQLAQAAYPSECFDLVTIWHVLEHLPDPAATLAEAHRILKPGGAVVVAVPNYSSWQARVTGAGWFHLDPPRHLFQFSLKSLETVLRGSGFHIASRHHFSLRQNPFGWVQSLLNCRPGSARNGLYEWLLRSHSSQRESSWWRSAGYAACFGLGMPVALAVEIIATCFRQGATVHVVARKPK
jgi:2-polyprenyl-3-methyl-5-hydroxy-6-metoxy-1,4-benzoquinol methylase